MLIDTHCHLTDPRFGDQGAVLARGRAAGVGQVVAVGSDPSSNLAVLELTRTHAGVLGALGCHPERLDLTAADVEAVESQVAGHRPAVAALGEVGLPWYSLEGRPDAVRLLAEARERLARLLGLARRAGLPVSLHAPHGAAEAALWLLERSGAGPAVFHWHKAPEPVTRRIVEAGHFVGLTPEAVYRERDRRLAQVVPLAHVVLESDGPWPYGGEFGGQPGEPRMLERLTTALAELLGRERGEVVERLAENTRRWLAMKGPEPGSTG